MIAFEKLFHDNLRNVTCIDKSNKNSVMCLLTFGNIDSVQHICVKKHQLKYWIKKFILFNSLTHGHNCRNFAVNISRYIVLKDRLGVLIKMSLNFVPKVPSHYLKQWWPCEWIHLSVSKIKKKYLQVQCTSYFWALHSWCLQILYSK